MGLYVPLGQSKENPSLLVPFYKMERSELDDIVRLELSKQGITDELKDGKSGRRRNRRVRLSSKAKRWKA